MAIIIQELGIDNLAIRHRHVIAAQPLQHRLGIAADNPDLAKARQVEHANTRPYRVMFIGAVVEPVLALPAIFIFGLLASRAFGLRQEPVGALPAADLTETGSASLQPIMDR